MRPLLRILVLLLLPLAGCTEPPVGSPDPSEPPVAPLPAPILIEATMPPSSDATPRVEAPDEGPCEDPLETCHKYPFSLTRPANVTSFLRFGFPGNDLDHYLVEGDLVIATGATVSSMGEFFRILVGEGEYEIWVSGYTVVGDPSTLPAGGVPYSVQVYFDEPRAPNP